MNINNVQYSIDVIEILSFKFVIDNVDFDWESIFKLLEF